MMGKLMKGDEVSGVLVVVLSGTIEVLVANGPGRASFRQILSGCLSNPIPRPSEVLPTRATV